ncbi:MAG: protein-methionine-sulfoxide reductase catalytic subunit MsrP [Alphaproteobacteria bacterium]|nr:protein-methionine-sulfoxide reductase catalytic subunit MsrP [Alphaproteobacteria bacterium]
MLIKSRRGWELPERAVTSETLFRDRRRLVKGVAAGSILAAAAPLLSACDDSGATAADESANKDLKSLANGFVDPTADLYPVQRNLRYRVKRETTPEDIATNYINFYEFGSHKKVKKAAQKLPIRPWEVRIDGLVEKEITIGIDELIRRMPLEERIYRFRCVEAWAMVVPWSGFPMKALVDFAKPLGSAKYVRMETFLMPEISSAQRRGFGYPWPYVEGLTMAEATNELTLLVTGVYGKPVPPQNGAPLRLITPWKYGFKSIKSLVRFSFTEERPKTMWFSIAPDEYGFWANVNPEVPHARWSQATERLLGAGPSVLWERVPTQKWNGYGEFVADIYADLKDEKLFM